MAGATSAVDGSFNFVSRSEPSFARVTVGATDEEAGTEDGLPGVSDEKQSRLSLLPALVDAAA